MSDAKRDWLRDVLRDITRECGRDVGDDWEVNTAQAAVAALVRNANAVRHAALCVVDSAGRHDDTDDIVNGGAIARLRRTLARKDF